MNNSSWSLPKLLHALDADIGTQLARSRELIGHPVEKGDASEALWLDLLQKYLPRRYEARRAHVVDSRGEFSDQIDIVLHDRQYSPFVFSYQDSEVVPAESVYAVFEVKQALDTANIAYAHKKIASVRRLHRTSLPIPSAGGLQPAKTPHRILGGALALESTWNPPFGQPLATALSDANNDQQLDFVCVAGVGTVERAPDGTLTPDPSPGAGARFLLALIARLQEIATVPMIDVRAYAAWLK
jgi:hypothetical protein